MAEINLSGGEITILKTIGLGGGLLPGKQLTERMDEMESAEFLDSLEGLLSMDYVLANKVNIRTMDDVKSAAFRVNPAHARELRDAIYPSHARKPETRRDRKSVV